jgi:hypothetical protein
MLAIAPSTTILLAKSSMVRISALLVMFSKLTINRGDKHEYLGPVNHGDNFNGPIERSIVGGSNNSNNLAFDSSGESSADPPLLMTDLPVPANIQTNDQEDPRRAELVRVRAMIAAKRAEQLKKKDDELAAELEAARRELEGLEELDR